MIAVAVDNKAMSGDENVIELSASGNESVWSTSDPSMERLKTTIFISTGMTLLTNTLNPTLSILCT